MPTRFPAARGAFADEAGRFEPNATDADGWRNPTTKNLERVAARRARVSAQIDGGTYNTLHLTASVTGAAPNAPGH